VTFSAMACASQPSRELRSAWIAARPSSVSDSAFFAHLVSAPFRVGLHEAFAFAVVGCLVAAVASWSRGARVAEGAISPPASARARLL
jgi:hypothetical protein